MKVGKVATGGQYIYCSSCDIWISSLITYKQHFTTDFHKYNSKRKVVGLKPLSEQDFDIKMKEILTDSEASQTFFECTICRKQFGSKGQYDQHINSKKHKKLARKLGKEETSDSSFTSEDLREERKERQAKISEFKIGTTLDSLGICLFCNEKSEDLLSNMGHMQRAHSFQLPYLELIKDVKGVIRYLAEKIQLGQMCLYCNGTFKKSYGTQNHMIDKGHCIVNLDNLQSEYGNFISNKDKYYQSITPLYQRAANLQSKTAGIRHVEEEASESFSLLSKGESMPSSISGGELNLSKSASMMSSEEDSLGINEDDWVDVEDDHNISSSKDPSFPSTSYDLLMDKSSLLEEHKSPLLKQNTNSTMLDDPIIMNNGELLLGSGKIIGHRMYKNIYKQNSRLEDNRESVIINKLEHIQKVQIQKKKDNAFGNQAKYGRYKQMQNDIRIQKFIPKISQIQLLNHLHYDSDLWRSNSQYRDNQYNYFMKQVTKYFCYSNQLYDQICKYLEMKQLKQGRLEIQCLIKIILAPPNLRWN